MDPLDNQSLTAKRVAVTLFVAFLGCLVIWIAVPYNNFQLNNTYLSDSYLPEIVIALLLLLVLVINPLLKLLQPAWVMNRRQVALIGSLLLFAAIIPSNGLMRMFPRFVADTVQGFNTNPSASQIAAGAHFRQALFPDPLPKLGPDGKVQLSETPVSDQLIDELAEGAEIPWSAWVLPFVSWGMLLLALWAMMVGLGGVVLPQWRDRERLPFPLLNVYQAFAGDPDEKNQGVLPEVFKSRAFWIAATVVFLIHALRGLNTFTQSFPTIPLDWDLRPYFTEGIMRHATQPLFGHRIFFAIVGVAYFIPNRYAISVWVWVLTVAVYLMFGKAFIPAFKEGQIDEQAFGALLAIAVWVLWLGRAHWAQVGRAMFGKANGGEESRRDSVAGWMFAVGCAGIVLWLYWAGCSLWWSIFAMVGCAIVALLMARLIAETGIPVFWMGQISVSSLSSIFPLPWLSPAILYFTGVFHALVTRASAVSASVITTLALGFDRKASPSFQSRLALGGLIVLLTGFVLCGAVHLHMGYNSSSEKTEAKTGADSVTGWARVDRIDYEFFTTGRAYQATGLAVAAVLLWACSRFPGWPIHPVGILFCRNSVGNMVWFSIFLGWLLKTAITGLFGGGAYRKARPIFLGLIFGELVAVIVWTLVPIAIIWATGADPAQVPRYSLIQVK